MFFHAPCVLINNFAIVFSQDKTTVGSTGRGSRKRMTFWYRIKVRVCDKNVTFVKRQSLSPLIIIIIILIYNVLISKKLCCV